MVDYGTIDDAIFRVAKPQFQKVAMVVVKAAEACGATSSDFEKIAERLYELVSLGRLEVAGDPTNWRYSEVRLLEPDKAP